LVARETRGLAETPTVVMPAASACSASVGSVSARKPGSLAAPSASAEAPTTPWLRGWSPVKRVATEGIVHEDWATACSKTSPPAARRSTTGLGLGAAP